MLWCVWYDANCKYLVEASSSDEALQKGREIDPRAYATQVYLPELSSHYYGVVKNNREKLRKKA